MKIKLDIAKMHAMNSALQALDGFDCVIRDGANDRIVRRFYALGKARLDIARNLNVLKHELQSFDDARAALIREASAGKDSITEQDEGWPRFKAEYEKMARAEQEIELCELKADDLRLDQNDLPILALAALQDIIV
jgi:hypothetical protein